METQDVHIQAAIKATWGIILSALALPSAWHLANQVGGIIAPAFVLAGFGAIALSPAFIGCGFAIDEVRHHRRTTGLGRR